MKTDRTTKAAGRVACKHCATLFRSSERESEFCCSGCRFVFSLLHKSGLEDFYRYGETLAPVGTHVFHEKEFLWLRDLQNSIEGAGGKAEVVLDVQGISCAGCVWLLEAIFARHAGAVSCRVHSASGEVLIRWIPGACDLAAYAKDVQRFGYLLGPRGSGSEPATTRPLVRKLGICAALAGNAMLFSLPHYLGLEHGAQFSALFELVAWVLATVSMGVGGTYFFRRAWAALRRGDLHIDLPISLGLAFAYAGSVVAWQSGEPAFAYFDFVSIFTFLMLLGRWMQERSIEANRKRLLGLRLSAGKVGLRKEGGSAEIPAEQLVSGDRFTVRRGNLVPVRSRLLSGPGVFALNWITGEPKPGEIQAGGLVPSGARSVSPEPLDFLALENWGSSRLAALTAFDRTEPWRNSGLQRLIRIYLSCVLVVAALGFTWWLASGAGWLTASQVLISVLVVSCPCAIGVALPLLDDIAAARMQACGIYLREGSLWARLRKVSAILFDKTGTVTLENLVPANPEVIDRLAPHARHALLALVRNSLHPVASSLREILLARGVDPTEFAGAAPRETVGMGLQLHAGGEDWKLGRASWAAPGAGLHGTVLSLDRIPLAAIEFREELRPDATAQVQALGRAGYDICLLSGDAGERVRDMARALGLPDSRGIGDLDPMEKAAWIRERWPGCALMLGDGANDSLAFDAALCTGTPAVDTGLLEHKSDFYMLGRSLSGLGMLLAMARRHGAATRAIFGFAILYNAAAVSVSLAGWMNPLVAAIIMPLSSLASVGILLAILHNPSQIQTRSPTIL